MVYFKNKKIMKTTKMKKIRNLLLVVFFFCLGWFIAYAFTHVGLTTDQVIQDTAITDIIGLVCFATAALIHAKMDA